MQRIIEYISFAFSAPCVFISDALWRTKFYGDWKANYLPEFEAKITMFHRGNFQITFRTYCLMGTYQGINSKMIDDASYP